MNDLEYEEAYQIILRLALDSGAKLRLKSCVDESTAEKLLGYAKDTLRKRVADSRNTVPYIRIGNRRFYDLRDIAKILATKKF